MPVNQKQIIRTLKTGHIVCMPSDTVYGIFADALNERAVERLYEVKGRDEDKPFIILISDRDELETFGVTDISEAARRIMQTYTPGPVTFILKTHSPDFDYLKRGGDTLAFRIPADENLWRILKETGPLVAPSANPQSLKTATNIEEAKAYFGENVDLYIDGGEITGEPSTIIDCTKDVPEIIRKGKIDIHI